MRLSIYNFIVPYNGKTILYNSLSNILFVFTNQEFSDLQYLLENLDVFEKEYESIFKDFVEGGFIINNDFDEIEYIKLQNRKRIFSNLDYHIMINPTLDCNLACWYCSVKYENAKFRNTKMSATVVESIKTYLSKKIFDDKVSNFHIAWFGGEPTMYYKEVMLPICDFLDNAKRNKDINVVHSITTNATLLNLEIIKEMQKFNFISFQIPIDGNSRRHNLIKKDKNIDTYKAVLENINNIYNNIPGAHIIIRVNYDRQTLKNLQDVLKDLPAPSSRLTFDFQRVWQIKVQDNEYDLLLKTKQLFNNKGYLSGYWTFIPKKFIRCNSDKYNYFVINYDGNVFKCPARNYNESTRIGTLNKEGEIEWNDSILTKMYKHSTFENERCLKCKILPICFGPCIQKNYEAELKNEQLQCLYTSAEMNINSYIIEQAQNRNLL